MWMCYLCVNGSYVFELWTLFTHSKFLITQFGSESIFLHKLVKTKHQFIDSSFWSSLRDSNYGPWPVTPHTLSWSMGRILLPPIYEAVIEMSATNCCPVNNLKSFGWKYFAITTLKNALSFWHWNSCINSMGEQPRRSAFTWRYELNFRV